MNNINIKKALAIAGSDSSGGAGIQADIKTFCLYKIHALTAITSIVTMSYHKDWLHEVYPINIDILEKQIQTSLSIKPNGIKVGMLPNYDTIALISKYLKKISKDIPYIVIDPVLTCKGKKVLLADNIKLMKEMLIKNAFLITPNIIEAQYLTDIRIEDIQSAKKACLKLKKLNIENIIIKNIKVGDRSIDILCNIKNNFTEIDHKYIHPTQCFTHGAGCTFSSHMLCNLLKNKNMEESLNSASQYVYRSIINSYRLNKYSGSVQHNIYT